MSQQWCGRGVKEERGEKERGAGRRYRAREARVPDLRGRPTSVLPGRKEGARRALA